MKFKSFILKNKRYIIFLKDWISLLIIGTIVTYGWQALELLMIKKINPNNVDTVIGFILILSLYKNFKTWRKAN